MVDAEDAAFRKDGAELVVDDIGAGAVMADRLLDDDARTGRRQPLFAETLRHRTEEIGTGREIEGANALVRPQEGQKLRPAVMAHDVDGNVVDPGEEAVHRRVGVVVGGAEFDERVLHRRAKRVAVVVAARDTDDTGRFGELLAFLPMHERRVELAVGEVACAAEDDEIERFDFHDACCHWRLFSTRLAHRIF